MPESVILVPYDRDWPRRFDQEAAVLATVFAGSNAAIEHIGSTAVPGLGAKPVIDVMIGLQHLADAERRIAALEAAGYDYIQKYETELPERRYFRKPRLGPSAYHLHCVVEGSDFWVRHLAFRDYLRAHPESAAAYDELKRTLAVRVSKAEYTEAKSPFIEGILVAALGPDGRPTAKPHMTPNAGRCNAAPLARNERYLIDSQMSDLVVHDHEPLVPGALVAAYRNEIWPEPGTEASIGAHLEREYGGHVAAVAALDAAVYAIDWADGRRWIARLFPRGRSLAGVEGDADILRFLAEAQFPAERCAAANAVTSMAGRGVLVTSRVSGTSGRQARGIRFFEGLGELLGRLQTLESSGAALRRPAGSWHHLSFDGGGRRDDIDALFRLLTDGQAIAPARDRPLYGLLRERLAELDDCGDLPQSLIHPDFSPANTIGSPDSGTVLIDWTSAGTGARILALGTLLACTGGDIKLVDAIIANYRRHVQLAPDEIARLPDAIRGFGLIVDGWRAVFRPKALERVICLEI